MKVKEIMSEHPLTCRRETDLSAAAWLMWEGDCGVLPVVDDSNQVVGMITDRDICMASATKGHAPSDIYVGEVATGGVVSCGEDDDIMTALKLMKAGQVRRLPVTDRDGTLVGVLSMNDVILHADNARKNGSYRISISDAFNALKEISKHRFPETVLEVEHEKVSDFDFEE